MAADREIEGRNKALVRQIFEEVIPSPELPADIERLIAADFVDHDPPVPERARGVDSFRATHAYLHQRWPAGPRFTIEDIVAEGDRVAVRWSAGPARAHAWFRVEDGKLAERWAIVQRDEER